MPITTIKTLKPHNDHELKKLLEHVYGINPDWITVSFDDQKLATIDIETEMDIDSRVAVNITDGGMVAEFSLFPAINKGKMLTNEDIEKYLLREKGLSSELLIWDNIKHSVQYFLAGYIIEKVLVAEGIPSEDGQDAWINLHFEIPDRKPKELEDGTVDYREINHIVSVDEGDLLISFHQETSGRDGTKVTGDKIPAIKGKKLVIHKGRGVIFDDEKQAFVAKDAGHIIYNQNRISVNPIYSVPGDVDFSVGNINFDGTVSISGDVLSGFEVRGKNIVVWGIVKDATLIAKNDLTIKTGVKATGKSHLEGGNNIFVGFMENATVYAGTSVTIKYYSLHSKIYSEGEVNAYSGDGMISGGEVQAFSHVRVRKLGMEQGPAFKVIMGVKHTLNEKLEKAMADKGRLEEILKEADDKIRKMIKINPDVKNDPKLKSILFSRNLIMKKYESADEKVEQMIKASMHPMPYVRVDESINDGVTLVFYSTEMRIPEPMSACKFIFNKSTGKIEKVKADAPLENTEVTEVKLNG